MAPLSAYSRERAGECGFEFISHKCGETSVTLYCMAWQPFLNFFRLKCGFQKILIVIKIHLLATKA